MKKAKNSNFCKKWGQKIMENFIKLEKSSSKEVEKGYVVDNYFNNEINIGYSMVQTHLNGKHPTMLNKSSNRTYFFIDGSAEFVVDGKIVNVKKDDMLVIKKNTKYSFRGNFDAILVDCPRFNPADDVIFD
jgi:mannose-6-phosphate isomerase-like protein (cupin superfamily)